MAAPKANEMFVAKKEDEAITGDARDDTGRLKSSGMNRNRSDKNPVGDEHDFASARGQLGKTSAPKVDDEKLEAAKAKLGISPGVAKVSNQMFVAKKEDEAISGDARDDTGRLKSSGMERDRTDKNPVGDEFNFADLRAGLGGKKKKPGSAAPSDAPSPSVAPSQAIAPTIVPPTPQRSKAGSVASMPKSVGSPVAVPKSPVVKNGTPVASPSPAPGSRQQSVVGTPKASPVQGSPVQAIPSQSPSQAGGLSRQSSTRSALAQSVVAPSAAQELPPRTSSRAGSVTGSVAARSAAGSAAGPPAGSAAGSQPALSRQGSAVQSHHTMSRQPSVQSRHSHTSQLYSPTSTQQPVAVQEVDELAGVDWKLTADRMKKQLADVEKKLSQKDDELRTEKSETRDLRNKVRDLENRVETPGGRSPTGECHTCPQLRSQLDDSNTEVSRLEGKVRECEKTISELKNTVNRGSSSSMQHVVQMQEMQKEMVKLRAAGESREQLIRQLTDQLEGAHNAILASAQKGFEYDIKLHQARATMVAMLKKEKESPRRAGSHSQAYSPRSCASPRGTSSSPTANVIHHYSPTIRTPASPTSLR